MEILVVIGDPAPRLRPRRADRLCAGSGGTRRRLVDRHPARGGDAAGVERGQQIRDADDPVLCAGRRDHGRGRHGAPPCRLRQCAGRHGAAARRAVRGQRPRHDVSERHLGFGGRRHLGDRVGHDPADGEDRLSARLRHQCDDQRLGAGTAGAAEPQRGDLLARHRRHDLDHQPVHGRGHAGPAARRVADRAVPRPCLPQRPPARRGRAVARGGQDCHRRASGASSPW